MTGSSRLEVLTEGGVDRNLQAQVVHVVADVDRLFSVGLCDLFEEAFPLVLVFGDRPEVARGFLRLPEKLFGKLSGAFPPRGAVGFKVGVQGGVVSIVLRKLLLNRLDCPTPDRVSVVKGAVHLFCP